MASLCQWKLFYVPPWHLFGKPTVASSGLRPPLMGKLHVCTAREYCLLQLHSLGLICYLYMKFPVLLLWYDTNTVCYNSLIYFFMKSFYFWHLPSLQLVSIISSIVVFITLVGLTGLFTFLPIVSASFRHLSPQSADIHLFNLFFHCTWAVIISQQQ